jgi:hypothetical protein
MSTASLIGAASTTVAAGLAGWFAWLARRAQSHGPESVAGGYSRLVADMRSQHEALQVRMAELESQRAEDHARIVLLSRQVDWLLENVSLEQRAAFRERFAGPRVREDD